jgi:hypothetical protein
MGLEAPLYRASEPEILTKFLESNYMFLRNYPDTKLRGQNSRRPVLSVRDLVRFEQMQRIRWFGADVCL